MKTNTKHSLFYNIHFIIKETWKIDKQLFIYTIINMPVIVLITFTTSYISKHIVQLITNQSSPQKLIIYIAVLFLQLLLLHIFNVCANTKVQWKASKNRFLHINVLNNKIMDMDYENFESSNGQTKMQKAMNSINNNSSCTQQIFSQLVNIISNLIGVILYSFLICFVSPWLMLIIIVTTFMTYFANHLYINWHHKNKDHWILIERKLFYVQNSIGNFEYAKDIRLYGMANWFKDTSGNLIKERLKWSKKDESKKESAQIFDAVMSTVKNIFIYFFLLYAIYNKEMNVSDFVFYLGIISQYSVWLLGAIDSYNSIEKMSLDISDLREFLDLQDSFNRNKGEKLPDKSPAIKFENVSYHYGNSEIDVLRNISVSIKSGEKIALVGLNGAGKTTFVKLICGLYKPSKGNIIVSDHSIYSYNRDEYYSLLSAVFQDICLMPNSIAINIANCRKNEIDKYRLHNVICLSGLSEKVEYLSKKEDTLLLKSVQEDAIDLSGGEKQRLILARALYKGGKIMILDEPTAAIDPIAENEIYQKYNSLTEGTTSIFISHRLASTRFCDRILFMEDGRIVEEGTHEELMRLGEKYAELFNIQSQYYSEEGLFND